MPLRDRGPKQASPAVAEPVNDAVDQRVLGTDDGQVDALFTCESQQAVQVARPKSRYFRRRVRPPFPALPGATNTFSTVRGFCGLPGQRMFASTAANYQYFHTQCLKCRMPVKHHRHAVLIGRRDDFVVPHRTTRLNDGCDSGFSGGVDAVPETEKRRRKPSLRR